MTAQHDQSALLGHYSTRYEEQRLERGTGELELRRTQDIMQRVLPAPPARVLDIGGGPGRYAAWLAALGYDVELLDIVPLHVEQALARFAAEGVEARARVADARSLPNEDGSYRSALLMGPLYHLQERAHRLQALREAWRVLEPGGVLLAAAISRFASLIHGYVVGHIHDPAFVEIMEQDLVDGRHRNPTGEVQYFTEAYFHHPHDLVTELEEAGFATDPLIAVEGPLWIVQNFEEHWSTPEGQQRIMKYLRQIETEPTMIGASAHIVAVGRKKN